MCNLGRCDAQIQAAGLEPPTGGCLDRINQDKLVHESSTAAHGTLPSLGLCAGCRWHCMQAVVVGQAAAVAPAAHLLHGTAGRGEVNTEEVE